MGEETSEAMSEEVEERGFELARLLQEVAEVKGAAMPDDRPSADDNCETLPIDLEPRSVGRPLLGGRSLLDLGGSAGGPPPGSDRAKPKGDGEANLPAVASCEGARSAERTGCGCVGFEAILELAAATTFDRRAGFKRETSDCPREGRGERVTRETVGT